MSRHINVGVIKGCGVCQGLWGLLDQAHRPGLPRQGEPCRGGLAAARPVLVSSWFTGSDGHKIG